MGRDAHRGPRCQTPCTHRPRRPRRDIRGQGTDRAFTLVRGIGCGAARPPHRYRPDGETRRAQRGAGRRGVVGRVPSRRRGRTRPGEQSLQWARPGIPTAAARCDRARNAGQWRACYRPVRRSLCDADDRVSGQGECAWRERHPCRSVEPRWQGASRCRSNRDSGRRARGAHPGARHGCRWTADPGSPRWRPGV